MRIKGIDRTSTIAWSPGQQLPFLAMGTVAGALDASFSTKTELELFDLNLEGHGRQLRSLGSISVATRFNRIAWGLLQENSKHPRGILAGGMENGGLEMWDPRIIIDGGGKDASIMRQSAHRGPVRGLDFNPIQGNLLASGATEGEIYIWDMTKPSTPYSPGARSSKLEDITALQWNRQVPHILASSSTNGYTVIWDLRSKRELLSLAHPGGRKLITGLAWNVDAPTQLVTTSDDDMNPVIQMWDLRNARAPEKLLSGHTKGVLSVSWCPKDSDLLVSCGKDNRTLVWNAVTGEVVGDLHTSSNWSFDVQWCTGNPDLIGVASFDGKVTVHSLMASAGPGSSQEDEPLSPVQHQPSHNDDPFDPFTNLIANQPRLPEPQESVFVLTRPPKWLRRPGAACWGFGGKLVNFNSQKPASPQHQDFSKYVSIRSMVTENAFLLRAANLFNTIQQDHGEVFHQLCKYLVDTTDKADKDREVLKFLDAKFSGDAKLLASFFGTVDSKSGPSSSVLENVMRKLKISDHKEKSATVASNVGHTAEDANHGIFTNGNAGGDFLDGDHAPTVASAAASFPQSPFQLYPAAKPTDSKDDLEIDSAITKATLIGDFKTAVSICLATDRLSDAIMLAVSGGEALLARTQKAYFEKMAEKKSYARLLQGVCSQNMRDIVENVVLDVQGDNWKDVMAYLFTHGINDPDFKFLLSTLGSRLEHGILIPGQKPSKAADALRDAREKRSLAAVLCYITAGDLEKVVGIWSGKLAEEEKLIKTKTGISSHSAHILALQSLIEKVTISRKAMNFEDLALQDPSNTTDFTLSALYDLYTEYAGLLAQQGKINYAWSVLELIPVTYRQHGYSETADSLSILKDKLYRSGALSVQASFEPAFPFESIDYISIKQAADQAAAYAVEQARMAQQQQFVQQQQPHKPFYPAHNGYAGGNAFTQPNGGYPGGNQNGISQQPTYSSQYPAYQPQRPNNNPYEDQWKNNNNNYPTSNGSSGLSPSISNGNFNHSGYPNNIQYPNHIPNSVPQEPELPPAPTRHPYGDRSHIPASHKMIVDGLEKQLKKITSGSISSAVKRAFEDVEKKLNILFDQMNNSEVSDDIISKLKELVKALETENFASAESVVTNLITKQFDEKTVAWSPALKRLVAKLSTPEPVAPPPNPLTPGRPGPPIGGVGMQRPPPTGGPPPPMGGPMRPPPGGPSYPAPSSTLTNTSRTSFSSQGGSAGGPGNSIFNNPYPQQPQSLPPPPPPSSSPYPVNHPSHVPPYNQNQTGWQQPHNYGPPQGPQAPPSAGPPTGRPYTPQQAYWNQKQ